MTHLGQEPLGGFDKELKLSKRETFIASLIGVLVVLGFCRGQFTALCEYPAIYDGARLIGTPYLYDAAHNGQEQIRDIGKTRPSLSYGRLPFYAALVWPLGRLPYHRSLIVWEFLNAIALASFVILWPVTKIQMTVLACAWSIPAALTFLYAQDDLWLLVLVAVLFRWRDSRPLIAGLAASLLSIKFHLFLFLPLLLIGRRKMAIGFAIGCAVLIALSFAVGGLHWPVEMGHVLSSRAILSREYVMPNVRGLLSPFTDSLIPEILLDLLIVGIVFCIVRRMDFEIGMAAVLTGSLLVSHHAGPEDCVVLIPALLALGERSQSATVVYCLALLSPAFYAFLSFGGLLSEITVLAIGSILFVLYRKRPYAAHPTERFKAAASGA